MSRPGRPGAALSRRTRRLAGYRRALEPVSYAMESRKGAEDAASTSASVEVVVNGELPRGSSAGPGPVDALEKALRTPPSHRRILSSTA
jgi:hypothetical protein